MTASPLLDFAIALFIGALIGIERERKLKESEAPAIGGLRTFILFSEAGALGAWLSIRLASPWIFVGIGIMVAAVLTAGYVLQTRASHASAPGMTTEMAAVVVFLLGGATLCGERLLAVALAIATAALLAYKEPLHLFARRISRDDMAAALQLLFATFIVLPVLPNRPLDPWGALNPYRIWWLVILIAGLSLVGYVASRWLGEERGASLTGLAGGLVSSTVISFTFARRSRAEEMRPGIADGLAAGLLFAWAVMFARILVAVAVVNLSLLPRIVAPMLVMGFSAGALGLVFYRRAMGTGGHSTSAVPLRNPFSLIPAIQFAILFTVVILAVKLAHHVLPERGLYGLAAVAGLTDVDAISLTMSQYARDGGVAAVAAGAIAVAALTNTAAKCGIVAALGSRALFRRVLAATLLLAAAGAAALALG